MIIYVVFRQIAEVSETIDDTTWNISRVGVWFAISKNNILNKNKFIHGIIK